MRFASLAGLMSLTTAIALAETLKVGDFAQGAEFSKCIKITDFNSKSLGDEVEVVDKVDGCCPEGYIPGIKHYKNYWGAMVICGFKDDGSLSMKLSTSNGVKTCEYNKCYVVKMDLTCKDDSKMTLDGCCPKGQYTDTCSHYAKSQSFFKEKVGYCLSYQKKYKLEGTADATDDQVTADGVTSLSLTNLRAYTVCPGGFGDASGGTATEAASPAPAPASDKSAAPASEGGKGPVVNGEKLTCDSDYMKNILTGLEKTFENYKGCDEKTQMYTLEVSGYSSDLPMGRNGNVNKYGIGMMCVGGNTYYVFTEDTEQATWDAFKASPPDESKVLLKCLLGEGGADPPATTSSALRAAVGMIAVLGAFMLA